MITLRDVSKKFRLYRRPSDRLLEWMHLGPRHQEFFALRDVSLHIPKGRTVGIVGQNGAGKSTLLKLITGTLLPSTGSIEINGRVAALLELGTGFHPEFTGRQNIYMNGQLLGLTQGELRSLEPEIIDFSELGPFIDQPIRTYSSGMILRLGFAIAAAMNPELLIVDEALSVGDARFSQKCIRRIREFRDAGTTILFVSHDPGAVTTLCDEAILLERGEVVGRSTPKEILEEYKALLAARGAGNVAMKITRRSASSELDAPRRHGTFQAIITKLEVCNARGVPADVFHPEDEMLLRARIDFLAGVTSPTVGFLIKDRLGMEIFGTNTLLSGVKLESFRAGEFVELDVRLPLALGYGDYSVTVAIHEDETHLEACYEWTDNAAIFRVRAPGKLSWYGVARLQPAFETRRGATDQALLGEALQLRYSDLPDPLSTAPRAPSPFVSGFGDAPGHESLPLAGREARFLFQPRHRLIVLDVENEADVAAVLSLSLGGGVLGRCEVAPGRAGCVFPVPASGLDRAGIFDLTASAAAEDQSPQLRLYQVRSTETPEESQQWPITMSTR